MKKESFEEWLQEETKVEYRTDENGDFILDENGEKIEEFYTYDGVPYPAITQTQVDKIRKAVDDAFVHHGNETDLVMMILEESAYYFDNKKSLEEVTDIIQNRIQIYLSER